MTVEQTSNDPKRALCEEGSISSSSIARNFRKWNKKWQMRLHFLSFNPAVLLLHFLQKVFSSTTTKIILTEGISTLLQKSKKKYISYLVLIITLDSVDKEIKKNYLVFEKYIGT